MEVDVADGSYTVTYFVNDVQKYKETFNSAFGSADYFVLYMNNYEYQEHQIDNFVATVISPAAE